MGKKKLSPSRKKPAKRSKSRLRSAKIGFLMLALLAVWGLCSEWYVHHSRKWLAHHDETLPSILTVPLLKMGNPLADLTDSLGWTGHDAVYEYDTEAPEGSVTFAGAPKRTGSPAPDDIRVLDRGEFQIGWSDKLRHPVWCAYHVVRDARYENTNRPGFTKDRSVPRAPSPSDYTKTGYDRGHMAPNYAILTRYGQDEQKKTFKMTNVAPQTPALNRGVWRNVEHRIADLWTARYGEIWVVVGCIPGNGETLSGTDIDVPTDYYQVIIAQEGMDVRAVAMLFSQQVSWNEWAARNIITIDELENLTGLDFNPEMPSFIQDPLESELPSRLWPIRWTALFKLIGMMFR